LKGTKEEEKEGAKEARIKKISIPYLQLGFSTLKTEAFFKTSQLLSLVHM